MELELTLTNGIHENHEAVIGENGKPVDIEALLSKKFILNSGDAIPLIGVASHESEEGPALEMRFSLFFSNLKGKKIVTDGHGNRVDIEKIFLTSFSSWIGTTLTIMVMDDRNDTIPFNIETAKNILGQRTKGIFLTSANMKKVKIYNASLKGDWPVMGVDPDGAPCLWDENGKPQNGNPDLELVISIEKKTK